MMLRGFKFSRLLNYDFQGNVLYVTANSLNVKTNVFELIRTKNNEHLRQIINAVQFPTSLLDKMNKEAKFGGNLVALMYTSHLNIIQEHSEKYAFDEYKKYNISDLYSTIFLKIVENSNTLMITNNHFKFSNYKILISSVILQYEKLDNSTKLKIIQQLCEEIGNDHQKIVIYLLQILLKKTDNIAQLDITHINKEYIIRFLISKGADKNYINSDIKTLADEIIINDKSDLLHLIDEYNLKFKKFVPFRMANTTGVNNLSSGWTNYLICLE